jgi:hypothetical protein
MPLSSSDRLIAKTIRALWRERDRITEQIAALSKLAPGSKTRPQGRRLALVRGKGRKKG